MLQMYVYHISYLSNAMISLSSGAYLVITGYILEKLSTLFYIFKYAHVELIKK